MNRNSNSRFAMNPTNIDIQRSRFDRTSTHKTTFNTGKLIPIYIDEVLPGDTFEMKTAAIIRGSTPIFPVMDNSYLDIYYFFVPNRLVWDHWKEFNGENTKTAWEQTIEYQVPQTIPPTGPQQGDRGWHKGDLADYFGIPTQVESSGWKINSLPFRAYCLIWNEWFRDQNLQDPILIDTGDASTQGKTLTGTGPYTEQDAIAGATVLPANKPHDYFTSALPEPQKGPDVLLPLSGNAPVTAIDNRFTNTKSGNYMTFVDRYNEGPGSTTGGANLVIVGNVKDNSYDLGAPDALSPSINTAMKYQPSNLWADLSEVTAATINDLRLAFQIQKLYEKDARGGTRYIEILKAHFGVTSPDARLQRPEYLGGEHIPINIDQVVQTSASAENQTPQGNTAAFSLTGFHGAGFTHSFVEHGYLIGLACVRTDHTYQQGLERIWSRKTRFDFYWPALANIGEQAILNKEIYLQSSTNLNEEAFGYQEAWAEYRYKPSRVSGAFRSNITEGSLDAWHYADYYTTLPTLSDEWIQETAANVDRTLAVQSTLEDQWIADFAFKCICTRPMPIYSIPGLIDHN